MNHTFRVRILWSGIAATAFTLLLIGCGGGHQSVAPQSVACGTGSASRFSIQDLGAIRPIAINNNGMIIAQKSDLNTCTVTSFAIVNGQTITMGGAQAEAMALDDAGDVVGVAAVSNGVDHAVLWPAGHLSSPPQDLGVAPGDNQSYAVGISNSGTIVGNSTPNQGATNHAVFWKKGQSQPTVVAGLPGSNDMLFEGINAQGIALGVSIFIGNGATSERYTLVDTNNPASVQDTGALAGSSGFGGGCTVAPPPSGPPPNVPPTNGYLNNAGVIAGQQPDASQNLHAYIRQANGQVSFPLGSDTASPLSTPAGINSAGQALIDGTAPGASTPSSFLVDPTAGVLDLSKQIQSSCGWTALIGATGINDSGQIVGIGTINGQTHGFLLTPNATGRVGQRGQLDIPLNTRKVTRQAHYTGK